MCRIGTADKCLQIHRDPSSPWCHHFLTAQVKDYYFPSELFTVLFFNRLVDTLLTSNMRDMGKSHQPAGHGSQ